MADGQPMVQMLKNLFANAARHAPASSPIRVAAARHEAHEAVSVSDEGRGVAPERLRESLSQARRHWRAPRGNGNSKRDHRGHVKR
ncbi:MAG: ATP-binding protein, partial [Rhodospirillaceae bacterium]|nr:ATP-binding protein [Rhodospirillaceae bacterium]